MFSNNSTYPAGFGLQDQHGRAPGHQEQLRRRMEEGLQKLTMFTRIQLCLALAVTACGIATLVVASENIGFPVFNFGPLLTGIFMFVASGLGFYAAGKGPVEMHNGKIEDSTRCMFRANYGISIAIIPISIVSAVVAFLSGAVCSGADIQFYSDDSSSYDQTPVDVGQYCYPNKTVNTALAFVDGALCILIVIWVCWGLCFYCSYGHVFGIGRPRRFMQ